MLNRVSLLAMAGAALAVAQPAAAAPANAAQCAIAWSRLSGSNDRAAVRRLAARCKGTAAGNAALAQLARTAAPAPVNVRITPTPPPPPPAPAPVRRITAMTAQGYVARGTAHRDAGRYQSAIDDFVTACAMGYGEGCQREGMVKEFNLSRLSDAMSAYRTGCRRGDLGSCTLLATAARTKVKPPDVANVRWALDAACTLRDGSACNSLGATYTDAAYGIDYRTAVTYFTSGCNYNIARSCENLRLMYSDVSFKMVDIPTALRFFDRAYDIDQSILPSCDGFAEACGKLATAYFGLLETKLNDAGYGLGFKVFRLASKACDGGYFQTCGIAGYMANYREPVLKGENRRLFAKGCQRDQANACARLGEALLWPEAGPVDPAGSREAYAKACRLGIVTACKKPPSPY